MTHDTQEQCDEALRFDDERGTWCPACDCMMPDSDMMDCPDCLSAVICGDCARKGLCKCKGA